MNIEKEKRFLETLKLFKILFEAEDMAIGGSFALHVHGFDTDPSDIDLELSNPSQSTLKSLKEMNDCYVKTNICDCCHYPERENHYRFKFNTMIIDVWVVDKIDYNKTVVYEGYKFGDVLSVIKKKMAMQRGKDCCDLLKYISQLMNQR